MNENLLIVEDEFIVANDLRIILENAGYRVCGTADSVDSAKAAVEKYKPTWVLLDIFLQDGSMGTELAPFLQEKGIGFIYISANTNQSILEVAKSTQPYGFLVKPFREKDLLIMLDIARSKHESNTQFAAQRELMLQQQVKSLTTGAGFTHTSQKVPAAFQSLVPFDLLRYRFQSASGGALKQEGFYRVGFDEYQTIGSEELDKFEDQLFLAPPATKQAKYLEVLPFTGYAFHQLVERNAGNARFINHYRLNSSLQYVQLSAEGILQVSFYSKSLEGFDHSHAALLRKSENSLLDLFRHLLHAADTDVQPLRRAARVQSNTAPKAVPTFEGIYGKSSALLHVLDSVEMVAATPVSVLILGESGTGKEKVAHNIHHLSPRKTAPFVTVNCAAMPAELIESELFGHEKGAFTGAVEKRIGKFEMANGGTIFLDEVGEMPLESQVKLLRVLQEKQFEHVGSSKTIKVDVRIVAATNRNLEKEVAEGRFRLDLFYRLNVFPIELPPLRERKEDIPVLAQHFLVKSAHNMGRADVPELSAGALEQLNGYHWPGNIRELEHLMERTLIKTRSNVIDIVELPAHTAESELTYAGGNAQKTLEQIEAEHILLVLKNCNGKVFGAGGAAEILGLPPSTLTSRMKKLGIRKELYHGR